MHEWEDGERIPLMHNYSSDNDKPVSVRPLVFGDTTPPAAQPAQEWSWVCNECGSKEFTSALSEADLEYLACAGCGCNEFHKEALAQPPLPVQEPAVYIRKDQLQKAMQSAMLCEVTPEPRQDRVRIYTTPQQRPWVGLTDEDVNSASVAIDARLKLAFHTGMYVAQKILMEKNT
jgi:hypothetical protein